MKKISAFFFGIHDKLLDYKLKKLFKYCFIIFLAVYILCNAVIYFGSKKFMSRDIAKIPACYVALVPGASVFASGQPSPILADRLDKAYELYKNCKIKRFLLSGDHGTRSYDEVNNMKAYLNKKGVPDSVIFTDHAGFDTYSSMKRTHDIFEVDSLIIVTQAFHLRRAIYIARKQGLVAYGYESDMRKYPSITYLRMRESLANIKAFFEVLFNIKPRFEGEKIPIKGDSRKSYD